MKAVWLNAWGGCLAEPLLDWIGAEAPDALFLQEVTRGEAPGRGRYWYRGGDAPLPQLPDLFGAVGRVLPRHGATFAPAARGPIYDDDGREVDVAFGLGTFLSPGLEVIGQIQGFVHGDFRPGGWGAPPAPRALHGVRVAGPLGRMCLAQTHGLRDPAGKHDTPARARQADRIADLLRALNGADEPLAFGGDLNLLPESATFATLGALGLADLVGRAETRTSHYPRPVRHADYLTVTPDLPVAGFEVVAVPEVSDHRALRLTLG